MAVFILKKIPLPNTLKKDLRNAGVGGGMGEQPWGGGGEALYHIIAFFPIRQVQLLVSDSDVKSYKQIKDDLDDLRLLVEKSELWVYKGQKMDSKKVAVANSKLSFSCIFIHFYN